MSEGANLPSLKRKFSSSQQVRVSESGNIPVLERRPKRDCHQEPARGLILMLLSI